MDPTGLFFAVHDEATVILSNERYQWIKLSEGFYSSKRFPLMLAVSGIGKSFASYRLYPLVKNCARILIMGTSGGLSDEKVGSIYLADEFVEHDMNVTGLGFKKGVTPFCGMKGPVIKKCSELYFSEIKCAIVSAGMSFLRGRIVSGDSFVDSVAIAAELKAVFGAALVDMESAAVAKICWHEKIDVAAVRYISDNANHDSAVSWQENIKRSASVFNSVLTALTDAE
jgi:adenosylhomocysteine nucleosidase